MTPHDVSSMVSVGDILARKYRVERILGTGGMGVVVAGKHVELNQMRAIKLMHAGALEDRRAVDRFLREAQAAVKLRSEHIAAVHDFGRLDSGAPYIVMELLQGEDLSAILKQTGPLPVIECVEYTMQACHALAEAHSGGIVHRDLKPGNLFRTKRTDGTVCIKVLDFGISKDLSATSAEEELTRSNVVMGTLQYMAPEQMRSAKKVDARADVYSLGAIMYKLLTGRAPFHSPQPTEIIFMTLDEKTPIQPPSELRPDISRELEQLILKCLDRDPAKRFATAGELLAALRPFGPCATLECDDGEKTVVRPSLQSIPPGLSPMLRTQRLPSMEGDGVPSSRQMPRCSPPTRPSVLDCFCAGFYFRPPPVPEYVPPLSLRWSNPRSRMNSHPTLQETMPPIELSAGWRISAMMHNGPRGTAVIGGGVRGRVRAVIAHLKIAGIRDKIKERPRALIGVAVTTWLGLVIMLVGLVGAKRHSAAEMQNASSLAGTVTSPLATFVLTPLPMPTISNAVAPTFASSRKSVPMAPKVSGSSKHPVPTTAKVR